MKENPHPKKNSLTNPYLSDFQDFFFHDKKNQQIYSDNNINKFILCKFIMNSFIFAF